jgi:hypothetical protein
MLASGRICLALGAVSLSLLPFASVASAGTPATVTVRVEGATGTVLPPTQVTTTTALVVKEGHSCSGTSAAGALQLATSGNWGGKWYEQGGFFVESIEGVSYAGSPSGYWTFWLDNKPSSKGVCESELETGASILFFPECFGECPEPPNPLGIEAPTVAEAGKPVTVTVISYANASGAPSPAAGAMVAYEGTSATADASGHATLTFSHAGQAAVKVTAPKSVRTETTICVHQGDDGGCGTQITPSSAGAAGGVAPSGGGSGTVTPFKGPYALVPKLTGLVDGHIYRRDHAPRVLAGSVLAHTTVSSVSLTLRREHRGRCWTFDGVSTRFVRARCGTGHPFTVSSNGVFSYLLPAPLAPGRYVLDIEATDAAGNRTTLARGTSRIVFYVR